MRHGILTFLCLLLSAFELRAQRAPEGPRVTIEPGSYDVRGTQLSVDEGRLVVPANRSSGSSATLALGFVRFRTTAASPGAPIVFLAGGPGDAGTRALHGMPIDFLNALRSIADVVAFDQRGTGTSDPRDPRCPPGAILPRDRAADPAAILASVRERVQRCLADAARSGIDVMGLTTAESADDLEALRRALGARKLSFLAGSYGTHLAIATARRHPESVDRMVLAGVEGPDDTFKLPSRVDEVLQRIAKTSRPSLLDDVRTLRSRLAAAPARYAFPGGRVIVLGEWDLQRWIAESISDTRKTAEMIDAIPVLLAGDYRALGRWALGYRLPRPLNLMNLAMDCASYASADRLSRIGREATSAILGNAINFPLPELCELQGLPRLPDAFRAPLTSDVPALLISGTLDGRTPVRNAVDVARGLPHSRQLVIEGASHGLLQEAEVMRQIVVFMGGDAR